jgi:hypothetical protein
MGATPDSTPELRLETVASSEETRVRCIGKLTFATAAASRPPFDPSSRKTNASC